MPFIVEKPALSFLWQQPGFRRLLLDERIIYVQADQCLFGSLWRKRTGFLTGNIPKDLLEKLVCKCASRGAVVIVLENVTSTLSAARRVADR